MQTECMPKLFEFEAVERRSVVAGFDGGNITSNAGALLLGQVDRGLGLVRRFANCFIDEPIAIRTLVRARHSRHQFRCWRHRALRLCRSDSISSRSKALRSVTIS